MVGYFYGAPMAPEPELGMASILDLPETAEWLAQFREHEQPTAIDALKHFKLVSRDELATGLTNRLKRLAESAPLLTPMGLYAERSIRKWRGMPNRLFKESRGSHKRAYGAGPPPVLAQVANAPQVGSEGLIGNLITQLCRESPSLFISHPGPDVIRQRGVRSFVVVTDFVGTGDRLWNYFTAAWRVASVKSWRSLGLLSFLGVPYSTTASGRAFAQAHRCRPRIEPVHVCTTTRDLPEDLRKRFEALCLKYDPERSSGFQDDHLGYSGTGALISFAHGCPNNVPRIFTKARAGRWKPLFPARVNTLTPRENPRAQEVVELLVVLGQSRDLAAELVQRTSTTGYNMLLFLQAVRRGPREEDALARRTGLAVLDIRRLKSEATSHLWLTNRGRLSDQGLGQLRLPSESRFRSREPPEPRDLEYYPKSLRAPFDF